MDFYVDLPKEGSNSRIQNNDAYLIIDSYRISCLLSNHLFLILNSPSNGKMASNFSGKQFAQFSAVNGDSNMENINQKECIKVNFSESLGVFDRHYFYPQIDSQETHNGPTGKVKDIQGIQAHAGHNFFVPEGIKFSFDIDECPHLHIAIKAEKGTNTCLVLCVSAKKPREHIRRHIVIGKTLEGDPRLCHLIKDCFEIKDDGQWHEYNFDLRKIREIQDNEYPYYPDASSVCMIQFYSWTGSGKHTLYFNDLSSAASILQATGYLSSSTSILKTTGHLNFVELEQLSKLTLKELKIANPELYSQVKNKAIDSLRTFLDGYFQNSPDDLNEYIAKVNLDQAVDNGKEIQKILLDSIESANLSPETKKEAQERITKLDFQFPMNQFDPNTPLKDQFLMQEEFHKAKLYLISDIIKLPDTKANSIVSRIASLSSLDDTTLTSLVKEEKLTDQEAKSFGFAANLHQIVDQDINLTKTLIEQKFSNVSNCNVESLKSLAVFDSSEWLSLIQKAEITPPEGMTAEKYAITLTDRIAVLFPTDAFLARAKPLESTTISDNLEKLQPLIENNDNIFDKPGFNYLNTQGLDKAEIKSFENLYSQLKRLSNLYPGLRIESLLDDPQLSTNEKSEAISKRVGLLSSFKEQNPNIEFLTLDYSPDSEDIPKLNFSGLTTDERRMVLSTWKAHQRIYTVSKNVDHSKKILEAGYNSALSIATTTFDKFAGSVDLSNEDAHKYYAGARTMATSITAATAAIIDYRYGGFNWLNVDNTQQNNIQEYLKKVDGYADLFGNQSFCNCQHCQSIVSPAAYFVDMMKFIDDNVTSIYFTKGSETEKHSLSLKNRRPDLWALNLTCENTNTEIPSIVIINEILEAYIGAGEMGVYKLLSETVNSFKQPFNLYLEKLQIYLEHFGLFRADIARMLRRDPNLIARATLNISYEEYLYEKYMEDLLKHDPESLLRFLSQIYQYEFVKYDGKEIIQPFDAQILLKATGLSRSEIDTLIETVPETSGVNVEIRSEKKDEVESIQNDIEFVYNCTLDSLEYIHRFIRVWRHLPWSMDELHLVLTHLSDPNFSNFDLIEKIVDISYIQNYLGLSVEESCGIWSRLPGPSILLFFTIGIESSDIWSQLPLKKTAKNKPSFLEKLFNPPSMLLGTPFSSFINSEFTHPSITTGNLTSDQMNSLHRLRSGLRITDEELYLLIINLSDPLGLKLNQPDPKDNIVYFKLNIDNLSLLYRHAVLAKRLKLSIPDLFQLISHVFANSRFIGNSNNLSEIKKLFEFYEWWKLSGYSLDDIVFIIGGKVQKLNTYPDAESMAKDIVDELQAENTIDFADTVFVFLKGITEEQSRKIITLPENQSIFIKSTSDDSYYLSSSFDSSSTITLPGDIVKSMIDQKIAVTDSEAAEKIKGLILKYHASEILPNKIAEKLKISVNKVKDLINLTGNTLFEKQYSLALLKQDTKEDLLTNLYNIIKQLIPLTVLFRKDVFDPDYESDPSQSALKFVKMHHLEIFKIQNFGAITLDNIKELSIYAQYAEASKQDKFSAVEPRFSPADLRETLLKIKDWIDSKSHTADKLDEIAQGLSRVLKAEIGLVKTLLSSTTLMSTAPEELQLLQHQTELMRLIGIGGETLHLIVSDDFDELKQASDAVLSGIRAKYPDEREWEEKIELFEDKIRSCKRNALVDYLTHNEAYPEFKSGNDIYNYLLIDVELEGCARTSRVVAGMSSLQLYVHRILMNLEQDNSGTIHVQPSSIPIDEWEWRKNYRVWEANRKVFLYPENYIEPDLRHDKTPIFQDLESKLLQQEINEQNVLDAHASYMKDFDEIAKLQIAGCYHDINNNPEVNDTVADTLHLFGITRDDPPVYYYRTVDNLHWGGEDPQNYKTVWHPWHKINVQIPVRKVSPVIYNKRLYVFWVYITTIPKNEVTQGTSKFIGYNHKVALKYSSLQLDGTWTAPQSVLLDYIKDVDTNNSPKHSFPYGEGIILDDIVKDADTSSERQRYDIEKHNEPREGYSLKGFQWDQVYPTALSNHLFIIGANFDFIAEIDFYKKELKLGSGIDISDGPAIYCEHTNDSVYIYGIIGKNSTERPYYSLPTNSDYTARSLYLTSQGLQKYAQSWVTDKNKYLNRFKEDNAPTQLLQLQSYDDVYVINGSTLDVILDIHGDLLLVDYTKKQDNYLLKRIGTTCSENLASKLFTDGLSELLDYERTQRELHENKLPILSCHIDIDKKTLESIQEKFDFSGPYGIYYREIFFQIPFLIANHLNSKQKFAAARSWYHYIFNPTASESPSIQNEGNDRNWRYLEFRDLGLPRLHEILYDESAIAKYGTDPFNPFAIADLRLSSYQKCIVMKYIDNLLDWGDSLFAQYTTESVNEATLLYIMAADLLGERPADIGDCGEGKVSPKNYEMIKPYLERSEFFPEIETIIYGRKLANARFATLHPAYKLDSAVIRYSINSADTRTVSHVANKTATEKGIFRGGNWTKTKTASWNMKKAGSWSKQDLVRTHSHEGLLDDLTLTFGASIARQVSPIFCVPVNKELLAYWDRVEDRLFKVRHCMDITGVKRTLALFAPEIDPQLLVKATAAGLSIEDVLNATSGNLPPYRFSYLIEKAKSYASVLQQFGGALLSALEKKDVEELNILRTIHEQNLQKFTSHIKQWEINAEEETILSLERRKDTVTKRKDHYQSLKDTGLTDWERTEQVSRHIISSIRITEAGLEILSGVTHLVPQLGAPFALKYGGKEIGDSLYRFANSMKATAYIAEAIASSAALEASHQRREEEWYHQITLADAELKEIEKQLAAAQIRKQIADRSLEIHQKSIEQTEAIYDLYANKFTNTGLYIWLSTQLQRLYRDAYNGAYAMAKLAEKAYEFERGLDPTISVGLNCWDASHAGLLSGERLLLDLQNLERKYIETNYRNMEIDQSFSLYQINPEALINLRETGTCTFKIPEIFFDLFYPGQYRRKIKAVRLTIPCVTGPYVNVSATLRLTGSQIRNEPKIDDADLKDVPLSRSFSIATSKAQNDAGVFEFNFRDERYMPFEGAGAISEWKLSLPMNFKQFDYQTIRDVILHINYTAEEDEKFRETVEGTFENIHSLILTQLSNEQNSLSRTFSLRYDFPDKFFQLVKSPENTDVAIEITPVHFPFFLMGLFSNSRITVQIQEAYIILKIDENQTIKEFEISIGISRQISVKTDNFSLDDKFGKLPHANIKDAHNNDILGGYQFKIVHAGDLAPTPAPNDKSAIDLNKLKDIMLYVKFNFTSS
jgi:hypothetical protein